MADRVPLRYSAPCVHWSGREDRFCGAVPTRLYDQGPKCREHTPSALRGRPEPGERAYCAPSRCYCGKPECPAYATYALRDRYAEHTSAYAAIDARAIAKGSRRSNAGDYTAARATVQAQQDRDAAARRAHPDRPSHPEGMS